MSDPVSIISMTLKCHGLVVENVNKLLHVKGKDIQQPNRSGPPRTCPYREARFQAVEHNLQYIEGFLVSQEYPQNVTAHAWNRTSDGTWVDNSNVQSHAYTYVVLKTIHYQTFKDFVMDSDFVRALEKYTELPVTRTMTRIDKENCSLSKPSFKSHIMYRICQLCYRYPSSACLMYCEDCRCKGYGCRHPHLPMKNVCSNNCLCDCGEPCDTWKGSCHKCTCAVGSCFNMPTPGFLTCSDCTCPLCGNPKYKSHQLCENCRCSWPYCKNKRIRLQSVVSSNHLYFLLCILVTQFANFDLVLTRTKMNQKINC